MALFQPFKRATAAKVPNLLDATIAQGQFDQRAKMQANSLRSRNVLGVANLYNEGTLADFFSEKGAGTEVDPGTGIGMDIEASAGTDFGMGAGTEVAGTGAADVAVDAFGTGTALEAAGAGTGAAAGAVTEEMIAQLAAEAAAEAWAAQYLAALAVAA